MKFAKELEEDSVPEWRAMYINYKKGKKKIKAISKALRAINKTPKLGVQGTPSLLGLRPTVSRSSSVASLPYTHYDFNARAQRAIDQGRESGDSNQARSHGHRGGRNVERQMSQTMFTTSPPIATQQKTQDDTDADSDLDSDAELDAASGDSDDEDEAEEEAEDESDPERTPLRKAESQKNEVPQKGYGSFEGASTSKSSEISPLRQRRPQKSKLESLKLPDPAMGTPDQQQRSKPDDTPVVTNLEPDSPLPETRRNRSQPMLKDIFNHVRDKVHERRGHRPTRVHIRELFKSRDMHGPDVTLKQQEAYSELDARQDDFFNFLDAELKKVDKFYKKKEEEAQERLDQLRAQLHEHRDQRARDIEQAQKTDGAVDREDGRVAGLLGETPVPEAVGDIKRIVHANGNLFKPFTHHPARIGMTSKKMEELASPPTSPTMIAETSKDYVRSNKFNGNENVPHRFAKRRLKLAMQEFYRGLELLKSYALLNRTGFRKINKKYDKAVNARPPLKYLNQKVSEAHFVKSTTVDEYLVAVEDLYARYFERGNRKVAVNKLRSKLRTGDHSASTFRNGLFVAAGTCLGIAGMVDGLQLLYHTDGQIRTTTAYLLQVYAGYFLALLLFLIFVVDCKIWTQARINYIFVFEYDTRHVLDWRQLAEIPCLFLFLNGLILWLNFALFDVSHTMYQYWPILLVAVTTFVIFMPFRVLYSHARKWFIYSNFRLLLAGLFPVEFRDFFLGDMYCSETYTMSQLEVFFCLYAHNFSNPAQCNSNNSVLLGFFTTLPAVWRSLQCLRRYHDSRNWFPHLANFLKYLGNILYYMTLSLWRLNVESENMTNYRIAFIVFAAINGLYCSFWDIFMDWSLGNPFAKHRFLRDQLAYRRKYIYYIAMIENTILRQQWVFYALFTHDLQHSAAMSFFVALAEVIRRGIWVLFRVENEHTNNVKQFRASRDIPLPYSIPQSPSKTSSDDDNGTVRRRKPSKTEQPHEESGHHEDQSASGRTTSANYDVERQPSNESSNTSQDREPASVGLRALRRVGTVIAAAHAQDFTKKRRPEVVGDSPSDETLINDDNGHSSDDDNDDYHPHDDSDSGKDNDRHGRGDIPEQEHDHTARYRKHGKKKLRKPSSSSTAKKQRKKDNKGKQSASSDGNNNTDDEDGEAEGQRIMDEAAKEDSEEIEDGDAVERANAHDLEEARRLADGFHPESGLRGAARGDGGKGSKLG